MVPPFTLTRGNNGDHEGVNAHAETEEQGSVAPWRVPKQQGRNIRGGACHPPESPFVIRQLS